MPILDLPKKPSEGFLAMMIVQLRKCEVEVGIPLVQFLEDFEERNSEIDTYNDKDLIKAITQLKNELYPPEEKTEPDWSGFKEDEDFQDETNQNSND